MSEKRRCKLMKKYVQLGILIIAVLFSAMIIHAAVSWQTANQFTVAWDAVSTNVDGDALGETDVVKYEVFLANNLTDPNKTNPTSLGITNETTYTLTLNTEGYYVIGIKSLRYIVENEAEIFVSSSSISWSDDPNVGTEFGVRYFLPPAAVSGMRPGS
jgi:hypothetical protein